MKLTRKVLSGVKVRHCKNTLHAQTEILPVPDRVRIPMSMHIGAPCEPTVKVGDPVLVGQVIGQPTGYVSAPIHSSVSGKVVALETLLNPNGSQVSCVVIETDKAQTPDPNLAPPQVDSFEQFLAAVRDCGLVGLGGAGFPTHVKLNPKNLDEVDTLVVNGAECEPYITSDYHEMMENSESLISGAKAIQKYLGIKQVIIGIESNKMDAVEKLRELVKDDPSVQVQVLPCQYPQGAEKVLIYTTTGRVVQEGKLPADAGVIVCNVGTVITLDQYLKTGMPLVNKRVTVDGGAVAQAKVLQVPIGASIKDVIDFCGGYKEPPAKLIMGGPMMGLAMADDSYPVLKNTNALLAFNQQEAQPPKESACIRCGRCVRACPFQLTPPDIETAYKQGDVEQLKKLKANLCMECGCCSYVCPAKKPIVMTNRMAKRMMQKK